MGQGLVKLNNQLACSKKNNLRKKEAIKDSHCNLAVKFLYEIIYVSSNSKQKLGVVCVNINCRNRLIMPGKINQSYNSHVGLIPAIYRSFVLMN